MKVLCTGGAGFIGTNLVKRCLNEGWKVDVVDDLSNGHSEFGFHNNLYKLNYRLVVTDFASEDSLNMIRDNNYDVVFHIAAVPRVSYSVEYPLHTNNVNVSRTLALLDACRNNTNRVVFASSSSVYGGADRRPTPEDHPRNPKSPYALQKAIIEDYLRLWNNLYGLDSVALRFFNVFGPYQLGDSPYATAVSAWLTAIKKNHPIRFDGDGSQTRDMCYVDNVVDACVRAAKHSNRLNAECFNVACGETVSNLEIMNFLKKEYPEMSVKYAPWRAGDVLHTEADVSKASNVLGYVPVVKFWEGLDRTIEWFENNWPQIKNMRLST